MQDQIEKGSKWKEVKSEIQKTWSLLTHDEIESAKGSLHSLAASIQKKYGLARHEVAERLSYFVDRLAKADKTAEPKQKANPNPSPNPPKFTENDLDQNL